MQIWCDKRRGGFHGRGKGRLRKIHREARRGRLLGGFGGLLVFEFLAAVTAGDFAEAFGSGIFLGADGGIGRSSGRCGRIIFAGLDSRTILLGEDLRLLQIFIRINVRIFFLLRGFAGFFGARGFGDGWRIGLRILGAGRQREQGSGCTKKERYAEAEWPAGGPSKWGRAMHQFCETALGDARAEATLNSGEIVPFPSGGGAIDLCERGIPRKYWSARTVAGAVAAWCGVEAGRAVG